MTEKYSQLPVNERRKVQYDFVKEHFPYLRFYQIFSKGRGMWLANEYYILKEFWNNNIFPEVKRYNMEMKKLGINSNEQEEFFLNLSSDLKNCEIQLMIKRCEIRKIRSRLFAKLKETQKAFQISSRKEL